MSVDFQKRKLREGPIQKGGVNGRPTNPAPTELRPKPPLSNIRPLQYSKRNSMFSVPEFWFGFSIGGLVCGILVSMVMTII